MLLFCHHTTGQGLKMIDERFKQADKLIFINMFAVVHLSNRNDSELVKVLFNWILACCIFITIIHCIANQLNRKFSL